MSIASIVCILCSHWLVFQLCLFFIVLSTGAIGRLAVGDRDPWFLVSILKGLFATNSVTHEEIHFAVGMSLARLGRYP